MPITRSEGSRLHRANPLRFRRDEVFGQRSSLIMSHAQDCTHPAGDNRSVSRIRGLPELSVGESPGDSRLPIAMLCRLRHRGVAAARQDGRLAGLTAFPSVGMLSGQSRWLEPTDTEVFPQTAETHPLSE